ncbi:hypothetical protein [Flavobacterium covae]
MKKTYQELYFLIQYILSLNGIIREIFEIIKLFIEIFIIKRPDKLQSFYL